MSANLELIWKEITCDMPQPVYEWWWSLLISKYNESGRNCHNLDFLQEKFNHFETVRHKVENPEAVSLALFFQYLDYDAKTSNVDLKNAENFTKFAKEAGIPQESNLYQQVQYLLEAGAIHSTEEHKIEGAFGKSDVHYFLDIDMAVLGSAQEVYAQHANNIELEYSFLDKATYKSLRRKVLQSFLLIPNIFATEEFRSKYEEQARNNISQELNRLMA